VTERLTEEFQDCFLSMAAEPLVPSVTRLGSEP
jgi:hypothetical protein